MTCPRCDAFEDFAGPPCPDHTGDAGYETCEHGLAAWLCAGPNHYPADDGDYGGPRLWDANPDVCCAAYQTGACEHTESFDYEE